MTVAWRCDFVARITICLIGVRDRATVIGSYG